MKENPWFENHRLSLFLLLNGFGDSVHDKFVYVTFTAIEDLAIDNWLCKRWHQTFMPGRHPWTRWTRGPTGGCGPWAGWPSARRRPPCTAPGKSCWKSVRAWCARRCGRKLPARRGRAAAYRRARSTSSPGKARRGTGYRPARSEGPLKSGKVRDY